MLPIYIEVFGVRHENTLSAQWMMVDVKGRLKKYDEAEKILNEVLPIHIEVFGVRHENTLWAHRIMADVKRRLRVLEFRFAAAAKAAAEASILEIMKS